ncbi:MAG: hypothetical protein ACYDAE_17360, partial [Steroidobacteraceae bacterium]
CDLCSSEQLMSAARADACTVQFFANEYWFARRLLRYGIDISAGITSPADRLIRARRGILEKGLAARRIVDSKPDTFADCFKRLYREPLIILPPESVLTQQEAFVC